MNNERIALLLGNDYGVRVVKVAQDELGHYRIIEPDPPIWFDCRQSDDPPDDGWWVDEREEDV